MMDVHVSIVDGPVQEIAPAWSPSGAGAVLAFEGIVRLLEEDRELAALDYEAYEPMATRMIERIARELIDRFGLIGMYIEHSVGRVPVGGCSFRLRVASRHRKEGLAAADAFIDRLKQDVPLWKRPVWRAG
jgi:molybdopterin synthase catalytic subunit